MRVIDYVTLGFILVLSVKGFMRGIIVEALGLLAVVLATMSFLLFGETASIWIAAKLDTGIVFARFIGYTVSFLVPLVTLVFIARIMHKAASSAKLGGLDRVLGFIFSLVASCIFAGGILLALHKLGFFVREIEGSIVAGKLMNLFSGLMRGSPRL